MTEINQQLLKPINECSFDELSIPVQRLCKELEINFVGELAELPEDELPGASQNREQIKEYLAAHEISPGITLPDEVRSLIASQKPAPPENLSDSKTSIRVRNAFARLEITTWSQIAELTEAQFFEIGRWNSDNIADVNRNLKIRNLSFKIEEQEG